MKLVGIGNEIFGDDAGKIVEEFGGTFVGSNLEALEGFMDDEVIIVDSSKSVKFLVVGLKDLYPGILSYSELEDYLIRARLRGRKGAITIVAFSPEYREVARCFLSCLLSKK
ncbi:MULTISPECIES: hypothetical protein [Metallosphaera]|uniref:Hydrogenase maturation protease n=3 Tax=Metallosphaera TaxID=41980 RepID=A4YF92_METS5|nr:MULTISPECIES: hypothetical protein [Metallosphaera]ABP95094.1 hypothetical protein Msed_0922 [Metallosphaera sedula DSM 5348]AIM27080.1 hypothetical protein HA72_0922 [Metallosphaera sedula]AKV73993.1 hypothetical protein MsedA_0938 [Metallosphaera sedula]AKV76232.1 hypothetical protein MsedB_0939 [Metallosphaera sedula]AKV78485.1 hypothetical protein MsedC_0938 [Metallosphaera sedula]